MMKYMKLIILSVVLVGVIALLTLVMIYDIDLGLFNNLSIASIQKKQVAIEELMLNKATAELNNQNAKNNLAESKTSYDVAKEKYENTDKSTIEIVQDATKEEKYFIEYLWIVLGNYAKANNVGISIITPGSVVEQEKSEDTADANKEENKDDETTTESTKTEIEQSLAAISNGVKIMVEGRYANVADFVFDVENDKSLRFKLDNIKMAYAGDNQIQAVFDVLSLSVLK